MITRAILSVSVAATLAACASSRPAPIVAGNTRPGPATTIPTPPVQPPTIPTPPQDFFLTTTTFDAVPGWATADMAPALNAFRRQCDSWRNRSADAALSGGR
jgi:hypothetical protein